MDIDPHAVKAGFDAFKSVIDSFKALREGLRSSGPSSGNIDAQIVAAERELLLAEAQLAVALGYPLCRAHFPPVPMLKHAVDPRTTDEIFRCPTCNLQHPSAEKLSQLHRLLDQDATIIRGATWSVFDT